MCQQSGEKWRAIRRIKPREGMTGLCCVFNGNLKKEPSKNLLGWEDAEKEREDLRALGRDGKRTGVAVRTTASKRGSNEVRVEKPGRVLDACVRIVHFGLRNGQAAKFVDRAGCEGDPSNPTLKSELRPVWT